MSTTTVENRTVSPTRAKAAIRRAVKANRPVMLWGPPGIGKSDIVHQIAAEQNREVIDVRLALWEPTDIKGIPFYDAQKGGMAWAPPIELPTDPNSTAVLFLDELVSAPPAVQAAAYQLILNRRVGAYHLPKGVSIIAAGNREGDRGVTYRMPPPLANRFLHLEVQVNFDDWFEWAVNAGISARVIGYLSFAKQDLFKFDPKSSSKAFPTPRSWNFVSDVDDDEIDENTLHDLVAGGVGDGTAIQYMAHRKIASQCPTPDDILDGKVKDLSIKEISAMYSLTTSMCYELKNRAERKDPHYEQACENFFTYMINNFTAEINVLGGRNALSIFKLPMSSKSPAFKEFTAKHGKYVIASVDRKAAAKRKS